LANCGNQQPKHSGSLTLKYALTFVAAASMLALAGCDQPKPREGTAPAAPQAAAPPPQGVQTPASTGLARQEAMATFTLDKINDQPDPYNKPATIPSTTPATFQGFIFDPVAKQAGKGADVVIDGAAYGTAYGHSRQDVAGYFKNPAVANSGFLVTLPVGIIKPGQHTVTIRVVSSDGTGYFDSAPIKFTAQ
jgi:hypothetical protein